MIIVVSNRNVQVDPHSSTPVVGDETLFGDDFNEEGGPAELRVAIAEPKKKHWKLTLLPDTVDDQGATASEKLFRDTLEKIRKGKLSRNWVVFQHGFNQTLAKNLKKAREIENYGVNVIAFSWPSNPGPNGGFFKAVKNKREEYARARANARLSITASDRFMEKLVRYFKASVQDDCPVSLSLCVHSLGNYLLQRTIEEALFAKDLGIFDNIILHQADADNRDHSLWVDRLEDAKRVYVTINLNDAILKASTVVNGRRLGNTRQNLDARLPTYVDFSFGQDVGMEHRLFRPDIKNPVIKRFFRRVFNGKPGENIPGLEYNPVMGAYQLTERPGETDMDGDA